MEKQFQIFTNSISASALSKWLCGKSGNCMSLFLHFPMSLSACDSQYVLLKYTAIILIVLDSLPSTLH